MPAAPIEGADFGPPPARPHGAPAAPPRFRYVVEHQPTARVRTLAELAGLQRVPRGSTPAASAQAATSLGPWRRSRTVPSCTTTVFRRSTASRSPRKKKLMGT